MRTVGAELEIAGFLGKAAQETGARSMDEGLFYLGKWEQPRKGSHNLEWLNLHEAVEKWPVPTINGQCRKESAPSRQAPGFNWVSAFA